MTIIEEEFYSFFNLRKELKEDFLLNNTNGLEDCAHFLIDYYSNRRRKSEELEMTFFILIAEALLDQGSSSQYIFDTALKYIESGNLLKIWSEQRVNPKDIEERVKVINKVKEKIIKN
ncbi:hypothetical protein V7150_00865 [Neobacillus drentensis]|uniref:hypothetical protein n=1 Tax=Neobacillus drentensis TaxID=220684 RepID=UPI002FFDEBDF